MVRRVPSVTRDLLDGSDDGADFDNSDAQADVRYGPAARNVMDVYLASGLSPTPLTLFIHGGSWKARDESTVVESAYWLARLLRAGMSVAAVNDLEAQQRERGGGPGLLCFGRV